MVQDKMGENTERKSEEPNFVMTVIKVKPSNHNQDKKKKRMAEYSAVTEGFPEEINPDRLINNVGQNGAYQKKP